MGRRLKDELERMCKKAIMGYFKEIFRDLSGGTEESHYNL
jgi:hypothetical protein